MFGFPFQQDGLGVAVVAHDAPTEDGGFLVPDLFQAVPVGEDENGAGAGLGRDDRGSKSFEIWLVAVVGDLQAWIDKWRLSSGELVSRTTSRMPLMSLSHLWPQPHQ